MENEDERTLRVDVSRRELATILAALRYYQYTGMAQTINRSETLDVIATDCDELIALSSKEIDDLCTRINTENWHRYGESNNGSRKPGYP